MVRQRSQGGWAASHVFIQMIANKHSKGCKKPFAQEHFNLKSNFTMSVFFVPRSVKLWFQIIFSFSVQFPITWLAKKAWNQNFIEVYRLPRSQVPLFDYNGIAVPNFPREFGTPTPHSILWAGTKSSTNIQYPPGRNHIRQKQTLIVM